MSTPTYDKYLKGLASDILKAADVNDMKTKEAFMPNQRAVQQAGAEGPPPPSPGGAPAQGGPPLAPPEGGGMPPVGMDPGAPGGELPLDALVGPEMEGPPAGVGPEPEADDTITLPMDVFKDMLSLISGDKLEKDKPEEEEEPAEDEMPPPPPPSPVDKMMESPPPIDEPITPGDDAVPQRMGEAEQGLEDQTKAQIQELMGAV